MSWKKLIFNESKFNSNLEDKKDILDEKAAPANWHD